MRRALEAGALAGLAIAVATLVLRDPGESLALATFVAAVGLALAAAVARLLLGRSGRSAEARLRRRLALRRGAAAGAAVAILLALRAIDGLNPFTAGFVVLAFGLAEVALTTRTPSVK